MTHDLRRQLSLSRIFGSTFKVLKFLSAPSFLVEVPSGEIIKSGFNNLKIKLNFHTSPSGAHIFLELSLN